MKARRILSTLLVFFTFFLVAGNALAEDVKIPAPVGDIYVQDFAHVLNESEKADLINLGRSIENQTTAQIAVLTVKTIGDQSIEEFSNEAFRQYGIGNKKENNGVLLVLSMKEHKVRIEVGYGLEGRIPDGKAGRILDENAIPNLKNQQPDKAVVDTYKVLANEVMAEYGKNVQQNQNTQQQTTQDAAESGTHIPSWLLIIVVVVVLFLDFKFFGGTLTYLLLSILSRSGRGGGGGGPRGGGGGSSGGGGAGRGW